MGSEDQALIVKSKKSRRDYHHPKGKHSHQKGNSRKPNRDLSKLRCFTCDERGHYARYFPRNKNVSDKNKGNKRRHHAHTLEDDESPRKRAKEESEDSSSDEEYVLISILTGTITHGSNDWLIGIGQWGFQAYDGIQRILCETI